MIVAKKKGGVAPAAPLIKVKVRRAILREVARRGDIIEMTQEEATRHGYNVEIIREQKAPKMATKKEKQVIAAKAKENAKIAKSIMNDSDAENSAEDQARAADEKADSAEKSANEKADAAEDKARAKADAAEEKLDAKEKAARDKMRGV